MHANYPMIIIRTRVRYNLQAVQPYARNWIWDPPSEVPIAVGPVALVISGIAFECKLRLVESVVDWPWDGLIDIRSLEQYVKHIPRAGLCPGCIQNGVRLCI